MLNWALIFKRIRVFSSRLLKWLAAEILAVILVAMYVLIDASDVYSWWVGDTKFVTLTEPCNLHDEACSVTLKDGTKLTFEISPKDIPLMKPLHFKVTSTHVLPSIQLKLFATNMNMGFHTITLKSSNEGLYEGEGSLPTCMLGGMIWQADIILNTPSKSLGALFTFQTDK